MAHRKMCREREGSPGNKQTRKGIRFPLFEIRREKEDPAKKEGLEQSEKKKRIS